MRVTLDQLRPGERGRVKGIDGEGAVRRRLLDMGLTPGIQVMVRRVAPLGDPLELTLRGYELSVRRDDARLIQVDRQR